MAREMTPGERIDLLREEKGWKQAELAERIGVYPSQISRIKTGNTASISSDILISNFQHLRNTKGQNPMVSIVLAIFSRKQYCVST